MLELQNTDNLGNYRISGLPGDSDRLITRKNLNNAKWFDAAGPRLWFTDSDDPTIRFYDPLLDQEVGSVHLPKSSGHWYPNVSVSRDQTRLYVAYGSRPPGVDAAIMAKRDPENAARYNVSDPPARCAAHLAIIDIETATLVGHKDFEDEANHIHLRSAAYEREDGKLLISASRRGEDSVEGGLFLYDPISGKSDYSGVDNPLGLTFHSPSPDGRYWLRWDMSSLPTTDASDGPRFSLFRKTGNVTRYYGKVIQLWSAFPLTFEQRIVSEWLRLDDLTDDRKFHASRKDHDDPGKIKRDIWDTIAKTSAECGAGPTGEVPRASFPLRYSGDNPPSAPTTWQDIQKNWRELALDQATVMGWQSDSSAFWTHRAGFLTCVGVDGAISPRLMLERHPLRTGTIFRSTESVRKLVPLEGRQAIATYLKGEALIDGSANTTSFEPVAISETLDHWRDTTAEREAMKARVDAEKEALRVLTVPLSSWSEDDCIAAINTVTNFVESDFHSKIDEYFFDVIFVTDGKRISERDFYERVAKSTPGATRALRRLVEAYIASQVGTRYCDGGELGALGHAVHALATLDDSALSILPGYYELLDTSNLTPFGLQTVPAVPRALGWTNSVIDFVVWYLMTEYWEGLCSYPKAWKEWGMGDAVMANISPKDFACRHETAIDAVLTPELAAEFDDSPYDEILVRLGPSISDRSLPWVQSFLEEMERIFEVNRNGGKWSDEI